MKLTLGINSSLLKARSQLDRSTDRLSTVYERLATGQRINRASDDPAGLAMASRLEADRRIANQGRRNVNDGISLLRIAQAAVAEIENIVQR